MEGQFNKKVKQKLREEDLLSAQEILDTRKAEQEEWEGNGFE